MALLLAVAATLVCAVKLLMPEHLTPVVEKVVNQALDATVDIGRVELSFRPAFPILSLDVDSITIVSHAFNDLDSNSRDALPSYADTLFTADRFSGAIDIAALSLRGEIALHDVDLVRPGMNIVIDSRGRGNFDIYTPDTTDTSAIEIPPFSIKRFSMTEPRAIRYFNAVDSTDATVMLLRDIELDGSASPLYSLCIEGRLGGPYPKELLQLDELHFGLDGRVRWEPARPEMIAVEDVSIKGAFATAHLSTSLAYDTTLVVNSGRLVVDPIAISDILTLVPDSKLKEYKLTERYFDTDGAIGLTATLTAPFVASTDTLPSVDIDIAMAGCTMRYGKARLNKIGFDIGLSTRHNCLDSTVIDIRSFTAAGPATAIDLAAKVRNIASDPSFDGRLCAKMNLRRLPPIVSNMAGGFISGLIDMDIEARGRTSMLSQQGFHKLDVHGRVIGSNIYYLSNDTAVMADINRLKLRFGTQAHISAKAAPTLAAGISADTASILIDGINITIGQFALGVGVENTNTHGDTTLIVPMGGALKIARLNIESVTDSAGVRIRQLEGHVGIERYRESRRLPLITARLDLGRLGAGTSDTRFILSQAHLDARMYRRPEMVERYKEIKHLSDSISRRHPELSADSVYQLAIEKRRHKPGEKKRRRVYSQVNDNDVEVLEWDLSNGMHKFMLNWQVEGSLTTRNARLFTPLFPLRNRIRQLDLAFSSDSIELRGVRYRAGNSDLALHGIISNLRRALTSKRADNTLKINLDLRSDTIDANQLSAAVFAGAAYMQRVEANAGHAFKLADNDDSLDKELDALVSQQADSVGPLLIPTNIDGRVNIKAGTLLYSDLTLHDLGGEILLYGGGLNLHNLAAQSDAGSMSISALYSAPKATDMKFGFGMQLDNFKIERFLKLVPAVDSIMPIMRDFSGIINADIAATVDIDSTMNMILPTLDAAIRLSGDSLAFIDPETYRTLGKWLRFRDKADNTIKHASVEFLVHDNQMQTFPFTFDIDRYRLGIAGTNDLSLNFNYHIAVLKSPLPFKFGITVSGNPDKYKIRVGGAKFKEGQAAESVNMVDTARVNLVKQIEGVFRRGVKNSRFARINVKAPTVDLDAPDPGLSTADSLMLQREGMIPENIQIKNEGKD